MVPSGELGDAGRERMMSNDLKDGAWHTIEVTVQDGQVKGFKLDGDGRVWVSASAFYKTVDGGITFTAYIRWEGQRLADDDVIEARAPLTLIPSSEAHAALKGES
jgi:hypothetical protein